MVKYKIKAVNDEFHVLKEDAWNGEGGTWWHVEARYPTYAEAFSYANERGKVIR